MGQQYVNSLGRDDRGEFLERRLEPQNIGIAGFQRAGFSSVLPVGMDTMLELGGLSPIFDFRSSGLKGGGVFSSFFGNPTLDLLDGAVAGTGGMVQSAFSGELPSDREAQAVTKLLLFQNMFGVRNVISAVTGQMPEHQF